MFAIGRNRTWKSLLDSWKAIMPPLIPSGFFLCCAIAVRAESQVTVHINEDFESTAVGSLPANWLAVDGPNHQPGGSATFDKWKVAGVDAFRAVGNRSGAFEGVVGHAPLADTDRYGSVDFDAELWTPVISTQGADNVHVVFDSGYRHNSNQTADLDYRLDGGAWQSIFHWADGDGMHVDEQFDNRTIHEMVSGVSAASTIQFRWTLAENFGWYWIIDNVKIFSLAGAGVSPNTPVNFSPAAGAMNVGFDPTFQGSAFSDADVGDCLICTQWQVIVQGGDFNAPLFDSGVVASRLNTFQFPGVTLTINTTYQWRVRYKDVFGNWSSYSTPTAFSTMIPMGLSFVDIQPNSGVIKVSSRGGSWGDYDADGYQDLFTGSHIYRNNEGDGTFTEVFDTPNDTQGTRAGTSWADYNNDGWLDLFVGSQWTYENLGGTGIFTLHDEAAFGLADPTFNFFSQAVAWADFNLDGWADIYIVGDQSNTGRLYQNKTGNLGFMDVTVALGVMDPQEGYGGSWGDYDGDGDQDLIIANCQNFVNSDPPQDIFFENLGGAFVENSTPAGVDSMRNNWATAWGDYDNDGDLDLYVVSTSGGADHFYRNNGNKTFTDLAGQAGIPDGSSRDAGWGDFDNDGDLDLYLATFGPNLLWINNGDGTFSEMGSETGSDNGLTGRVGSIADMDNDGDLDIFVSNSGSTPAIYMNLINDVELTHWLILRLEGTQSNRSAIGARVEVAAAVGPRGRGVAITQIREISGGAGLYTEHMLPVHFGLGNAVQADSVTIRWPSGHVQTLSAVAANQILNVKEESPEVWAQFDFSGTELGRMNYPYNTLPEALGIVTAGGTVKITSSSASAPITINQPVRIEAVGGPVRIGAP